jgi:tetratricopeptide (TPR) repeat protein
MRLIEKRRDLKWAYNLRALIYLDEEKYSDALEAAEQSFQSGPRFSKALVTKGNILARQGDFDKAIAFYKQALSIDSNDAVALTNIGAALIEKGDFNDAIRPLREAITRDNSYAPAYATLAAALLDSDKPAEALQNFTRAAELDPTRPPSFFESWAEALEKTNQVKQAEVVRQRANAARFSSTER